MSNYSRVIAVDIETDTNGNMREWPNDQYGLSYVADVTTYAYCENGETYYCLNSNWDNGVAELSQAAIDHICEWLNDPDALVIAHNAVFDLRSLAGHYNNGVVLCSVWDTLTIGKILTPHLKYYTLGSLAKNYGYVLTASQADMKGNGLRGNLHEMEPDTVGQYCADDATLTYKIYESQLAAINTPELQGLIEWEIRANREFCAMAAKGFLVDREEIKRRILKLNSIVSQATTLVIEDGLVDPTNKLQTAKYIYVTKRIKVPEFTPFSGYYTASGRGTVNTALKQCTQVRLLVYGDKLKPPKAVNNQLSLFDLAESEPPILLDQTLEGSGMLPAVTIKLGIDKLSLSSKVMRAYLALPDLDLDTNEDDDPDSVVTHDESLKMQYRSQLKALADYTTSTRMRSVLIALLAHSQRDGRIHSLIVRSATTGRGKSSQPQVENWHLSALKDDPAGDMCGIAIGDPGFYLIDLDYNNAEIRSAATIAGDSALSAACQAKIDGGFHAAMSAIYFPFFNDLPPHSLEWTQWRNRSKGLSFGWMYGGGDRKLAAMAGIELQLMKEINERRNRTFYKVTEAKAQAVEFARQYGYITLWTGRDIPVNKDKSYTAWNYLCQGMVGEMVKRSIVLIMEDFRSKGLESWVAIDMHDAVVLSVKCDEWDYVLATVSHIMEHIIPDEMNRNTDPVMVWVATPDIEGNTKKWGKRQTPPIDFDEKGKPISDKANIPQKPLKFEARLNDKVKRGQTTRIVFKEANFDQIIDFPLGVKSSELTDSELDKALKFTQDYVNAINTVLNGPYEASIPVDSEGKLNTSDVTKGIYASDPKPFNLLNYANVPVFWLYASKIIDITSIFEGITLLDLQNAYAERKALYDKLEGLRAKLAIDVSKLEKEYFNRTYGTELQAV